MKWLLLTDQEVVPDLHYPHEHAAGGETSLLMAIRPDLVDLGKTLETDGVLWSHYAQQPEHLQRRSATKHKYIGVLTGVTGASNDPELTASVARGELLLETIAQRIAKRAQALLSEGVGIG
jgi:creatinine amidohydrolase/Fe(II)-dependent formamide hydrolase-like protein